MQTINTSVDDENIEEKISKRPNSFDDFVGQEEVKENLKVFCRAAKARKDVLDHVLLYGPPGLGKTTLAGIIANEMESNLKITSAPAFEKIGELAAVLSKLEEGDILFIDEIHRLNKMLEEFLYSAMEDFKIDVVIGDGAQAKSIRLEIPKFTLVGATTKAGTISAPLRNRFGIISKLSYYKETDLAMIIRNHCKKEKLNISRQASLIIAKASRGTPRIALNLTRRVCDFALINDIDLMDDEFVHYALGKLGVSSDGLNELDVVICNTIRDKFGGGPVGISTLAAAVGEDANTIEGTCEPFLIFKGILAKTPKGRVLV